MSEQIYKYIPSGNSPETILQSLNDHVGQELALCGTWSPTLFYQDLKEFPCKNKDQLAELVSDAIQNNMSYLDFFEKSRGVPRKSSQIQKTLFNIFNNGSVMLYFESIFLSLFKLEKLSAEDQVIISYINALSKTQIRQWDNIIGGLGACCFQFFSKEPILYAKLIKRKNSGEYLPEEMTDNEMLNKISTTLSLTKCKGKISINDSRSSLIELYKEIVKF